MPKIHTRPPATTRPSTSTGLSLNKPLPPLPVDDAMSIYYKSPSSTKRHSFLSFFHHHKPSPPPSSLTAIDRPRAASNSSSSTTTTKSISAPLSAQSSLILSPKLETAVPPAADSPLMAEAPMYRFSSEVQERVREKGVKEAVEDEVQKEAAAAVCKMAARPANVEFFSGGVGGAFL
ncbi:MAG: hypothetical protein M1835_000073 [Candelina submexicana]|nr:MAG: hypothetical protein M1835_000073 [Candelina submexicana]